jgi:hypothetical protein
VCSDSEAAGYKSLWYVALAPWASAAETNVHKQGLVSPTSREPMLFVAAPWLLIPELDVRGHSMDVSAMDVVRPKHVFAAYAKL